MTNLYNVCLLLTLQKRKEKLNTLLKKDFIENPVSMESFFIAKLNICKEQLLIAKKLKI